jgi:hypothetical protein
MDDGIYLPFHADFSFTPYGGVFFKKFNSGERERENIKKRKKKDREMFKSRILMVCKNPLMNFFLHSRKGFVS